METLTIGFVLAWLAVSAYVAWLATQQGRMIQKINQLEAQRWRRAEPAGRARVA